MSEPPATVPRLPSWPSSICLWGAKEQGSSVWWWTGGGGGGGGVGGSVGRLREQGLFHSIPRHHYCRPLANEMKEGRGASERAPAR